jgi:hypothetical protein
MTYDYKQTALSKSISSGLAAGYIAALICLTYDFIFRDISQFQLCSIINVSSIIFGSVLIPVIAGIIFFIMNKFIKGGNFIYMIAFTAITLLSIYGALNVQRSPDAHLTAQFRILLTGIIITIGVLSSYLIPYMFKKVSF